MSIWGPTVISVISKIKLVNTEIGLDPNNSVIKRLWCIGIISNHYLRYMIYSISSVHYREFILFTGHTRTSLLRTLNSSGSFNADEWLLPETRQLFEKQAARQKKLAQGEHC